MISTERLQERMQALGLKPYAAAKMAGLGVDYVRDLLRGRVKAPSSWRLRALATALQCSPDYLMGLPVGIGSPPDGSSSEDSGRSIVKLTIRYELRPGYFEAESHAEISDQWDESYSVVSACDDENEAEWLELAMSSQAFGSIPKGYLLHVIPFGGERLERDAFIIAQHFRDGGKLVNRSAYKLSFHRDGLYLTPSLPGVTSEIIEQALAGNDAADFKIDGVAVRAYGYLECANPIEI